MEWIAVVLSIMTAVIVAALWRIGDNIWRVSERLENIADRLEREDGK
jgi:hypothetical protein